MFLGQDLTGHLHLFQICKLTMEVGQIGVSAWTSTKLVRALEVWTEQEIAATHQTEQYLTSIVEDTIS